MFKILMWLYVGIFAASIVAETANANVFAELGKDTIEEFQKAQDIKWAQWCANYKSSYATKDDKIKHDLFCQKERFF